MRQETIVLKTDIQFISHDTTQQIHGREVSLSKQNITYIKLNNFYEGTLQLCPHGKYSFHSAGHSRLLHKPVLLRFTVTQCLIQH